LWFLALSNASHSYASLIRLALNESNSRWNLFLRVPAKSFAAFKFDLVAEAIVSDGRVRYAARKFGVEMLLLG